MQGNSNNWPPIVYKFQLLLFAHHFRPLFQQAFNLHVDVGYSFIYFLYFLVLVWKFIHVFQCFLSFLFVCQKCFLECFLFDLFQLFRLGFFLCLRFSFLFQCFLFLRSQLQIRSWRWIVIFSFPIIVSKCCCIELQFLLYRWLWKQCLISLWFSQCRIWWRLKIVLVFVILSEFSIKWLLFCPCDFRHLLRLIHGLMIKIINYSKIELWNISEWNLCQSITRRNSIYSRRNRTKYPRASFSKVLSRFAWRARM